MREAYREIRKTSELPSNWNFLIFLARPTVLEVNYKQVYDAIEDCLKRALKRYEKKNP